MLVNAVCRKCNQEIQLSLKLVQVEISQKNVYFNCPNCNAYLAYRNLPDEQFNKFYRLSDNCIFIPCGKDLETKPDIILTIDDLIDFHFELEDDYAGKQTS